MLLPDEIVNKEFSRARRGYDIEEVEDFIELVLERYDALYQEKAELEKNLKLALAAAESQKEKEAAAAELLIAAKKESERIVAAAKVKALDITAAADADADAQKEAFLKENAQRDAESVNDATVSEPQESEADKAELSELETKLERTRREYSRLREEIDSFKLKLFDIYNKHISYIEQIPTPKTENISRKNDTDTDTSLKFRLTEKEGESPVKTRAYPRFDLSASVEETIPPVPDKKEQNAPVSDAESSIKYGLNIVRESIEPHLDGKTEENSRSDKNSRSADSSERDTLISGENFSLKFMSKELPKRNNR